jgi:hypothetical protein
LPRLLSRGLVCEKNWVLAQSVVAKAGLFFTQIPWLKPGAIRTFNILIIGDWQLLNLTFETNESNESYYEAQMHMDFTSVNIIFNNECAESKDLSLHRQLHTRAT